MRNSIIALFTNYYYSDQIEENQMGEKCSKWRGRGARTRNVYKIFVGNKKGDMGVKETKTLQIILKRQYYVRAAQYRTQQVSGGGGGRVKTVTNRLCK
jgi:hypothetical protein